MVFVRRVDSRELRSLSVAWTVDECHDYLSGGQ